MLITLLALGSGPASFLSRRFDAAARVAVAPVLGLCLGTCVFTTLVWFTAARNTFWLLPTLALVSVVVASRRSLAKQDEPLRRRLTLLLRRLALYDAIALVIVCVVVATPLSYTLHERHSVGPAGFEVWDSFAFTAEADGEAQEPLRTVWRKANTYGQNFTQMYWAGTALLDQQLDATPLSANLNELIGLHSSDTQSLFMIVFLMSGALGAFAAIRYATPEPRWGAPLAGILFAGPFFLQLLTDGSQPAVCGLALFLPIIAVGVDTLREPRLASLVLLALLVSGLMALYPLYVPAVAITAAIAVGAIGVISWWRGRLDRRSLLFATGGVCLLIALSILFDLVGFLRDMRYWRQVLEGGYYISSLPVYHLPFSVLPGWLFQTREFYFLTDLGDAPIGEIVTGIILPIIFVTVILYGLKRRPIGLMLAGLVAILAAMGEYTSASHHCSYCTDRAILPIAPLIIGLLLLGVAALVTTPCRWLKWAGIVVAVVAVISIGERARQERLRFADGGYFLEAGDRGLLAKLPPHAGPIDLEAFGQDPGRAPGELELVYLLASEQNHGQVSVPSEFTDYSSLAYLTNAVPSNPQFSPNYRYVLTRLGGVQTARRVIGRTGSLALEERTGPLDVTLVSGAAIPLERLDAQGLAWVQGPLHIIVVGGTHAPVWVLLLFKASVPVVVPTQPGVQAHISSNSLIAACVRATGTAPTRKGTIALSFPLAPGVIPSEPFAIEEPPQGVQLTAMRAVDHCSLAP